MPMGRVEHMTLYHRNLPPSVIPASKHFFRRQDGQFFLLSLSMVQSFLLAQRYFCFPERRNRQRLWLSLSLSKAPERTDLDASHLHRDKNGNLKKGSTGAHTHRMLQLEEAVNVTSHSDRSQPSLWALEHSGTAKWKVQSEIWKEVQPCVCVHVSRDTWTTAEVKLQSGLTQNLNEM